MKNIKFLNKRNKTLKNFLDFTGRVAISAIFISAIPSKIQGFDSTVKFISERGIQDPYASILLVGAIVCLVLGSGFFIFDKERKIGPVLLLLFLIPTTIIFHVFPFDQKSFLINIGLIGGLIITAVRD